MAFVDDYNPLKGLESQLDFPLEREGIELSIDVKRGFLRRYLLRIDGEEHDVNFLTGELLALVLEDGFVTDTELFELFSNDASRKSIGVRIKILKNISPENIHYKELKSPFWEKNGLYVGNLYDHRLEKKLAVGDLELNSLTEYLWVPDREPVELGHEYLVLLETLFRNGGKMKLFDLWGRFRDTLNKPNQKSMIGHLENLKDMLNTESGPEYLRLYMEGQNHMVELKGA